MIGAILQGLHAPHFNDFDFEKYIFLTFVDAIMRDFILIDKMYQISS